MCDTSHLSLALIGGRVFSGSGGLKANFSFGKIVNAFAKRYRVIHLCAPLNDSADESFDCVLDDNVVLLPQPGWHSTLHSLRHLGAIRRSYKAAITQSDHVFIRGNPVVATKSLYRYCRDYRKPVCHWIVGNPSALLQTHKRHSHLYDKLSRAYIQMWEKSLLQGRKAANGTLICNGSELAARYQTPKTYSIVSTTLSESDFFYRQDTCQNPVIQLACTCYVRPEKGVEYLIEALSLLDKAVPFKLVVAGDRGRYPQYQEKLDALVQQRSLQDKVSWLGHLSYTDSLKLLRDSDIFVLPTLSEGTPRVLVEARANGVPCVSTNVGGIPSSITDGHDGLLVPAKDPESLAATITRVTSYQELRMQLIKNGYDSVQKLTVNRFVDSVTELLLAD